MAETGAVEAYLKVHKAQVTRPLRLSIGAGLGVGLLVIVQAWLIARIVAAVLFERAALADVASHLALLPVVFVARAVLTFASEVTAFEAAAEVKRSLRQELLQQIFRAGPIRIAAIETGALVAAITDSVEAIHPYYARYLPAVSLTAMLPLAILVVVVPIDWLSALVFVVTAPLIPFFMILIGKGAETRNQRQWASLMRMSGHLLDAIQGLSTLKLFNASRREAELVTAMAEGYRRDTMAVLRLAFVSSLALEFFATVSIALVAVLIGFRLLWGEMSFFSGFFVLLLAPEFYAPLRTLGTHYHARMEAIGAADKIVEILGMSAPDAPPAPRAPSSHAPPRIVFDNVVVDFADGRRGLDGLCVTIEPGERIAVVGPSGAGKSTLFNLLLGFLTPASGRILVDGIPLQEIDPVLWRQRIAWVPQRPHIFRASALDNIGMAPHATRQPDREAIMAAVSAARADMLIRRLPDGLETLLAESGRDLSGGEAQRIALARAFYRRPALVLLDEPTAHLDPATEAGILEATARLTDGPTSLTIAHRLETVRQADRILVLDKGRLAEQGRHAALIEEHGLYARLARHAAMES